MDVWIAVDENGEFNGYFSLPKIGLNWKAEYEFGEIPSKQNRRPLRDIKNFLPKGLQSMTWEDEPVKVKMTFEVIE